MRRIKIVVSDFHLGTGRSAPDGTINELEDFVSDEAFIDMLEYYRTSEYADAEVEFIFNGDIFECLAVNFDDPHADMITAQKGVGKVSRIIDGHQELFRALRTFAEAPNRQVLFIVGNHDQDLLWEEVQQCIKDKVHPRIRFIHGHYRFDGVHIEHGNQHERENRVDPKKMFLTKGLPEPILNLPWGSDFFINSVLRLKRYRPYVNRVRPFRLAISWSLFHDFRITMLGAWYFLVTVIKARFRRHRQRRITFLDTVRVALDFGRTPTLEGAAKRLMQKEGFDTVVFGHTHIPLARHPFPGKSYVNSGSWIPNTNLHIEGLGRSLLQTYVYIEYIGEKPQARLKRWHGRRLVEEEVVM